MAHRRPSREPPDAAAALEIAVRFLGTRPRSRWEVERRLQRAGATPPVLAATVERLTALGYLDDAAFARWWGEQRDRHAPRGQRMVDAELRQRGVPREVIEAYRDEHRPAESEALPADEAERARIALARHLRGRAVPDEPRALQRLGTFLVRRGFDPETARSAVRSAAREGAEYADDDP